MDGKKDIPGTYAWHKKKSAPNFVLPNTDNYSMIMITHQFQGQ